MDFLPVILLSAVVVALKFGLLALLFKVLKGFIGRIGGFFGNTDSKY